MTLQMLIERVSQLTKSLEETAANYNVLMGRYHEAKSLLDTLSTKAQKDIGNTFEVVEQKDSDNS